MKFPTDRPVKVVMLGAGGTGGYVAPYVFRLLHMLDRPARFVVCDGDIVEPKNLDRQNFVPADLGENKARVLAERYSTVLGMETEYVPSFIEKLPDLMELIAALQISGAVRRIDGSPADLPTLVNVLSKSFNVRINNPEQCRHAVINRKLRLTRFLDLLRNSLIEESQR